jgi:hypothetical protein
MLKDRADRGRGVMTKNLLWRLCLATRDGEVEFRSVAIPALPGYAAPPGQLAL